MSTLSEQMAEVIAQANELQRLKLENRRLHQVAEAATRLRLNGDSEGPGRSTYPFWQELLIALDAAGYGPEPVEVPRERVTGPVW